MILMVALLVPVLAVLGARIFRNPVEGVYLFVALSGITIAPAFPVIGDRLSVADLVMVLTIAATALRGEIFAPPPPGRRLADQLAALFVALCTLSSAAALIHGQDPARVVLFSAIYLYGYLCLRVMLRLIDTPERFARMCLFWAAGAVLVSTVGVLAASGIWRPGWSVDPLTGRLSATMKMSGQVASYLGPALFILFWLGTGRRLGIRRNLLALGVLAMALVVMIGTGSRLAFGIVVLAVAYMAALLAGADRGLLRRGPALGALCLGLGVFLAFAAPVWTDESESYSLARTSPFERALRIFAETSRDGRAGLADWGGTRYDEVSTAAANLWRDPLFGTGSGMFSATYRLNEVHNTYVGILAENGPLALLAFLAWWGWTATLLLRAASGGGGPGARLMARLALGAFLSLALYQITTNGLRQRPFWFVSAAAVCAVTLRPVRQVAHLRAEAIPA